MMCTLALFLGCQREIESKFLHVLTDIVHQCQRKDPLFDLVDQLQRSDQSSQEAIFNPVQPNELGIYVPFVFVLGMRVDRLHDFVIDESLEYFLVAVVFSTVQADNNLAALGVETSHPDFDLTLFHG